MCHGSQATVGRPDWRARSHGGIKVCVGGPSTVDAITYLAGAVTDR